MTDSEILVQVDQWLKQVVLGLNLCPFAHQPYRKQQIKLQLSHCNNDETLLNEFDLALQTLAQSDPETLETTVIILTGYLQDFDTYLNFIALANHWIDINGYQGQFQLASFHPDYQFDGTEKENPQNLTNRSPYPLLHLIREQSITDGLERYPFSHDQIIEQNIQRVCALTEEQTQTLFPHLKQSRQR